MSDASSGGGYGLPPKKKVVRRKQKLTAVGQRGPVVAPKATRKTVKKTPASGVSGSVKAAGKPTRVSSTSRKPLVRSPLPGSGSPLRELAARTKILYNDPRYRKGLAGMLKPVDTSASKAITDVTRKFPKGVLAAGAGVSEGIRRLQGATDVSNAGPLPFGPNSIPERIARNAPKDAANVVVNSIPSTVHIISDAIRDQQDTLGRHGITRVGHDLADPYVELAKHPGKTLIEKPVSTALLVTGPIRGLSRGVGAVARRGVLGKAAKAAASTERAAATTAENTRIVEPRRYSPDPVGKHVQVLREQRRLRKIAKANRQAAKLATQGRHGRHAEAADLRNEAAQGHPTRVSEDQVKHRVDELVGINETVRRRHGGQVDQAVDRAVKNKPAVKMTRKARKAQRVKPDASVSLTAQNLDLERYKADLEQAYANGDLTPRQKASNREARAQVQDALDHPQDPVLVAAAARAYRAVERPITDKLVKYKMLDPEEAAKRRELPFAVQSLKAVRDSKPRLTDAGVQRLVIKEQRKQAAVAVKRAKRAEQSAARQQKAAETTARISAARAKTSPTLKALSTAEARARGNVELVKRQLRSQARRAGRTEGRAEYTARAADRALLMRDAAYKKLSKQSKGLNIEKSMAAKGMRNAERNPHATAVEVATARERFATAVENSRLAREALAAREAEIRAAGTTAVTKVAGERRPVMTGTATRKGRLVRVPANQAERLAKRKRSAQETAAEMGRRPAADLGRVEKARGRELELERQLVEAKAALERVRVSIRDERKRIKGVEPAKADRLMAALAAKERAVEGRVAAVQEAIRLRGENKAIRKATSGQVLRRAPGFVDEHGNPLSAAQIRAERLSGAEDAVTGKLTRTPVTGEPAYVSHMPGLLKGGSFFRDSARPVSIGKKPFTGATVTKTGFDASPDALHASARRLQSLVDAHEGHLRVLDEMSLRDSKGRAVRGTREQVQAGIDRATLDHRGDPKPGARNYRIVAIHPFGARAAQLDELVNQLNRHGEMVSNAKGDHNPVLVAMEDALAGKGNGPFAAIPEEAAIRMEQHLRVLGSSGGHVWQVLNTLWRKNVLAFSAKWGVSNVTEAAVRSLVAGVRPGDRALLMKTLDEWMKTDPDAAEAFLGSLGTGHYGFVNRTQRHATAEEFMDPARHGPFVRSMARIAGTINRTPVVNWVPKAWSAWTSHVMDSMGRIEGQFKMGLAGKKLRDLHQESRAFADTSEKAVQEALRGLKGTPSQIETARFARRMYGKYEAHSPQMRKWIEMYTPFVAWTLNAAKFIFDVLPRDHPVLTAFMADLTNSQEKWLRDVGLWIGERNTLPSYMLGDIPTGGGLLNVAKYTPASLMQDPIATVGSALLPSMTNLLMASKGLDPFGKPLKESRESAILKGLLGFAVPSPIVSPGSSGLLERLNPVQTIPGSRVDYARTKATLDRIDQQIQAMPADKKTKPYAPEYRKLLDQRTELQAERDRLLVEAGLKTDPAISVKGPLRLLRRQVRDFPVTDRMDKYGYESKAFAGLKSAEAQLGAAASALGPVKKKAVRVRKRPLTTADQVRKSVQDLRKRDVRQEVLDEIARLREQSKVNAGG